VQATFTGVNLDTVGVNLRSTSGNALRVVILPGTIFETQSVGVQNMVVKEREEAVLMSYGSFVSFSVDSACVNMELGVPSENDTFTISSVPATGDLAKLLNSPDFADETWRVQQFAI